MPTVALPDAAALHVVDRGAGDPPLLLVPGLPAVAGDWDPLVEALGPDRRVVAYDNRGAGGSDVTPGPYTTAQLADDAAALLAALGIERADVFGISLGGMIAQELALRHPGRVRRLVLGCTHAGVRHAERAPKGSFAAFRIEDWGERIRALASWAFSSDADPALLERFAEKKAAEPYDPAGYEALVAAVLGHDTADRLGQITAPTLVVTGDDDRVIPGGSSRLLADRIPGAELRILPGAGHLFTIEQPETTVALLREFLSSTAPGSASPASP